MAWYPAAVRKEVARFRTPIRGPVRVNLHTAVTNTTSLFSYFNRSGNPCSHFYVRKDGTVEQYVDTRYRAAADLQGNPDTISIETWDGYRTGAPGYWRHNSDVPPWTDAQTRSLAALIAWLTKTHPTIPARLARDSRPGASSHGISWHRLGIDPWRQSGGLKYSNARGKVCPGDRRVAQIPALLTAAVSGGVTIPTAPGGVPTGALPDPLTPEDFMATLSDAEAKRLLEQVDQLHGRHIRAGYADASATHVRDAILQALAPIAAQVNDIHGRTNRSNYLDAKVSSVLAAVAALGAHTPTADVDEDALARALADALPDELAEKILDRLAARLSS